MSIAWPASDAALLAWGHLLLAWVAAMYYVGRTASVWGRTQYVPASHWLNAAWPKAVVLAVVAMVVLGRRPLAGAGCVVLGAGCVMFLTWARERGRAEWHKRGAELELGTTSAYVALSALIVGDVAARPVITLLELPLPSRRVAALMLSGAIVLYLVRGGTQVVRAILNRADSLPRQQKQVDEVELNRGRLIGDIERLLLAGMVAAASYAALGFTIAAKGLIRSRDLEKHEFAEYFLIGTLASTMIALVAGGLLRV
ncbi:MAG: hypothetical protein ACREOK_00460, partial [Gemmatimonadaceae bacterium]